MIDIAIRVEHLGKFYRLGPRERYRTLRDTLTEAMVAPWRAIANLRSGVRNQPSNNFIWALKDVSFEIKRGEVVGIIGRNGAGKSTLLKILARITEPTEGYAEIRGRVGSLLEVGTGFHPELTGRENIYLSGAILGMKRAEIARKFDEIVAFADVEKFLDTPVKHYSSGMYVRLAFAIAAHLEPEILLVDEVLAVGDAAFQKKCLGKMDDVAKEGRTVLFVSHNMGAIKRLCRESFWLDEGRLSTYGLTSEIVDKYLTSNIRTGGQCLWKEGIANPGIDALKILSIRVCNKHGIVTPTIDVREPFWIEIRYRINRSLPYCRVGILINTLDGITVFESYDSDNERYAGKREIGDRISRCEIPPDLLSPGSYIVSLNAGIPNIQNLAFLEGVLMLYIQDTGAIGSHMHGQRHGIIRPRLKWECEVI